VTSSENPAAPYSGPIATGTPPAADAAFISATVAGSITGLTAVGVAGVDLNIWRQVN
jgi:hypothetical protein